jgi:PIN domain nuclease of toxin-antitoxin system
MKLLLDTHALLWWGFNEANKLSARVCDALRDPDNDALVSAAAAWEIATKYRIGKLPEAQNFVDDFDGVLERSGFRELPISLAHARAAGLLPGPHRDPFDRLLIAQAKIESATIVGADPVFAAYGVPTIW